MLTTDLTVGYSSSVCTILYCGTACPPLSILTGRIRSGTLQARVAEQDQTLPHTIVDVLEDRVTILGWDSSLCLYSHRAVQHRSKDVNWETMFQPAVITRPLDLVLRLASAVSEQHLCNGEL